MKRECAAFQRTDDDGLRGVLSMFKSGYTRLFVWKHAINFSNQFLPITLIQTCPFLSKDAFHFYPPRLARPRHQRLGSTARNCRAVV